MGNKLHTLLAFVLVLTLAFSGSGQTLGKIASGYAVFSKTGTITNIGTSHFTGDIGTDLGLVVGVGNFDGTLHNGDSSTLQCGKDLDSLIAQLNNRVADSTVVMLTANNATFHQGVVQSSGALLSGTIILDAAWDSSAVFVFRINGNLQVAANTQIILRNGAKASRVFWKATGLIDVGSNSIVKGTLVSEGLSLLVTIASGTILEGRILTQISNINLNSVTIGVPVGSGGDNDGPDAANLRFANCFALFSSVGALTNVGSTQVSGKIGTNNGTVTGFTPGNISQGIFTADATTAQVKTNIDTANNYINSLNPDIEILFPLLFGNGLTLTPHVYRLTLATVLTDTLFLDAQGKPNGVFVLKITGTLITMANAKIVLLNGAKACNVFWQVTGGNVTIGANNLFTGTLIASNDINVGSNCIVDGRLFTRAGDINVNTLTAAIPTGCGGCPYIAGNNPPHVVNDVLTVPEDVAANVNVLANDSDPDNDSLAVNIIAQPLHGSAVLTGSTIRYTPALNYFGGDTLRCRICDSGTPSLCDSTYLYINVLSVNDRPDAIDDRLKLRFNTTRSINILANDTDVENDPLTATIIDSADSGSAILVGGQLSYAPDPGFVGYDTVTCRVCDAGLCDTSKLFIEVFRNTPPVAQNDSFRVCVKPDTILLNVQANDSDADGDSLQTSITTQPTHGTVVLNGKMIKYTVTANYTGTDSFTYSVCDNNSNENLCDTATVYLTINPAPEAYTGPDQDIVSGRGITLGRSPVAGNDYLWTPPDNLSSATVSNPFANPPATTTYTLTETILSTGCRNTGSVIVNVSSGDVTGLGMYNAISPNDDGKNDFWNLNLAGQYPVNSVTILNRYGSEVWKAENYNNTTVRFEGRNMNGKDLPDGTYYYTITYDNKEKQGWILIKR